MHQEQFMPHAGQEANEGKEKNDHYKMRYAIRDLRDIIEESIPTFPNRARALKLVEELLLLVPPVSQKSEELYEQRRQMDRGEIEPYNQP